MSSAIIGDNVKIVDKCSFYECTSLTSLTIGNSVTDIYGSAFYGCSNLSSLTIPNSVESIGGYAFYQCSRLSSVILGNKVSSIGIYAFSECGDLLNFYCYPLKVPLAYLDFFYNPPRHIFDVSYIDLATLHVPESSLELYKNESPWSEFGKIVALTDEDPNPTGLQSLYIENNPYATARYTVDGRRISQPQRGLNIIRMSDGTTKKVLVK